MEDSTTSPDQSQEDLIRRMIYIIDQQRKLIKQFRQTDDKSLLSEFQALSAEFQQLRQSFDANGSA